MKNVKPGWKIIKKQEGSYKNFVNRKVVHVFQEKSLNGVAWKGELDGDTYFFLAVINGVLTISISEREATIIDNIIALAYVDFMADFMVENQQSPPSEEESVKQYSNLVEIYSKTIPDFIKNIKFEDVMVFFNWEYASPNVEICENMSV